MDVFFSADDRQEHLDLLAQSASKHALDFLAWCLMRNHAHVVVVPCQERSLACASPRRVLQFSVKVAGNLWQERFQLKSKVSVFSVYYLPSDPIDASFSSILG
jgi:putative transposase